jgi:hypothetical protein
MGKVVVALGLLLTAWSVGAAGERTCPERQRHSVPEHRWTDKAIFLYDAVARFNEMLIATIDAIDTALTAILAGDIAVVIFTIDKIAELQRPGRIATLALLVGSVAACATGYLVRYRGRTQDGIEPHLLVADTGDLRDEAIIGAIEGIVVSSDANLTIRFIKRVLAMSGMVLLIGAVAVVAVARLSKDVVQ